MEQGSSILAGLKHDAFSFAKEMREANFGDQRLTDRLVVTLDHLYRHPSLPVTGACENKAQVKAAYRLMDNEKVSGEEILSTHSEQTILRMGNYRKVFAVQDTTTLNYGSHLATEGLGQIGQGGGARGRGLFLHTTEAFSPSGLPLGFLDQMQWSREETGLDEKRRNHPLSESELNRWLLSLNQIALAKKNLVNTDVVVITDRESDFNDYLLTAKKLGLKVVVRAKSKIRANDVKTPLTEVIGETKLLGSFTLKIKQKKGPKRWDTRDKSKPGKKHVNREWREANVELRAAKIVLRRGCSGLSKNSNEEERTFWAIWVHEKKPPEEYESVEWLLLTNEDLSQDTEQRAFEVVDWYKLRWGIETFHKILKSGCRVESAQYDELHRLKKFITIMSLIAWRLHALIHAQRESPEKPCTDILSPTEWKVLYLRVNKTKELPNSPPTLREATHWIASLGGFLGRKNDPEPGPLTLWRGWQRLMDLVDGYEVLQTFNAIQRYGE